MLYSPLSHIVIPWNSIALKECEKVINDAGTVNKILDHLGESNRPPRISPARGPPLWEAAGEQARNDPQWDFSARPALEIEFDQRIAW